MRTHLMKGPKSAISVQYLTPEQREVRTLLVELKELKNAVSGPSFVVLVAPCSDYIIVSVLCSENGFKCFRFDYSLNHIRAALAFVRNAYAVRSSIIQPQVA